MGSGLIVAGLPSVASAHDHSSFIDVNDFNTEGEATDEKLWKKIAKKYYDIAHINLDISAAETSINKLAHFGTTPFAVIMIMPTSLAFQQQLGIERISARLHYLKNIWVNKLKQHPDVEVVVPAEFSCGIASFRLKNKTAPDVADYLFKQHKIFTVARTLGKDGCVRVTPSVYNSVDEKRRLVTAVKELAVS